MPKPLKTARIAARAKYVQTMTDEGLDLLAEQQNYEATEEAAEALRLWYSEHVVQPQP